MTIPTQPTTERVPTPPSNFTSNGTTTSDQAHDNLKHVARKVSQVNGGPVQGAVTQATASLIKSAATLPLVPDLQKAVATVRQGFKKEIGLEALLRMAPPLRDLVLTGLSDNELKTFEVALSKGTTLQDSNKIVFQKLKSQIDQAKQNHLLQEILTDHPTWRSQVEAWKGVSLEDKIWLLQLYELSNLKVKIPQIDTRIGSEFIPSQSTPDLLKPDIKAAINAALNAVTQVDKSLTTLQKCPKAICLLGNLQILYLVGNKLTAPPDVSKNVNLKILELNGNQLTASPDLSKNVNLQILRLSQNQLTVPPDVSKNVNLKDLDLTYNKLTAPPDVSKNVDLQTLEVSMNDLTNPPDVSKNVNLQKLKLSYNQLTKPPDVSTNVNLEDLNLSNNQLTTPPDVSNNAKLNSLNLVENQLATPPDVSNNVNLQFLMIFNNQLIAPPDVSKNIKLENLYLKGNQLTVQAKEVLAKLKSERENFTVTY